MPENDNSRTIESPASASSSASIKISNFLATGFYSGYAPVASGTCGTFVAMVLLFILSRFWPSVLSFESEVLLALGTTILGIYVSCRVCDAGLYGKANSDPKQIVIDEFAGFFVAMVGLGGSLREFIVAFFLFRFFDIAKVFPANKLEYLPSGWGIVLDDVCAGIYSALVAHLVFAYWQL